MNPANIFKSVFLEISAIATLMLERNFSGVIIFFILHAIASFFISQIILTLMHSSYKKNPHLNLSFMTIFNTAMLFMGYIASFYMAVVMLRRQKFGEKYEISSINASHLLFFPSVKRQLGEGAASVDPSYLSKESKLEIMAAFSSEIKLEAVRTMKKFLSDSDDEIRLYSFQTLNRIKNDINEKINIALSELEKEKDSYKKAMLEKRLALYYSNMFNLEISETALMSFFMDKSMFHLSNAEKFMSDRDLLFLRGQILFSKNEYDGALEAFEKALRYGFDEHAVYPLIAEIYYIKKNYTKVRETLKKDISLKLDFHTMPVTLIWERNIAYN